METITKKRRERKQYLHGYHYVYIYLDPTRRGKYIYGDHIFEAEPFYVGKGVDHRFTWIRYAIRRGKEINNPAVQRGIEIFESSGMLPEVKILNKFTNQEEAFAKEILMISEVGRRIDGSGPLLNVSSGGALGDYGGREVLKYDLDGKFLMEYISCKEAGASVGLQRHGMWGRCSTPNNNYYKHIWYFKDYFKKGDYPLQLDPVPKRDKKPKILGVKIGCYTLDKKLVKTFQSASEAARYYKTSLVPLNMALSQKENKYTCKGYIWRYLDGRRNVPWPKVINGKIVKVRVNKKEVGKYNSETGEFIESFESISAANRSIGHWDGANGINLVLSGKGNTAGGFAWGPRGSDGKFPRQIKTNKNKKNKKNLGGCMRSFKHMT